MARPQRNPGPAVARPHARQGFQSLTLRHQHDRGEHADRPSHLRSPAEHQVNRIVRVVPLVKVRFSANYRKSPNPGFNTVCRDPYVTLGQEAARAAAGKPGRTGGGKESRPARSAADGQDAYFSTRSPTCGSAASTFLTALPRTVRYALMTVGRLDAAARASVTESRASDTSPPRLAR